MCAVLRQRRHACPTSSIIPTRHGRQGDAHTVHIQVIHFANPARALRARRCGMPVPRWPGWPVALRGTLVNLWDGYRSFSTAEATRFTDPAGAKLRLSLHAASLRDAWAPGIHAPTGARTSCDRRGQL